jgi:hypothetical protein
MMQEDLEKLIVITIFHSVSFLCMCLKITDTMIRPTVSCFTLGL